MIRRLSTKEVEELMEISRRISEARLYCAECRTRHKPGQHNRKVTECPHTR